MKKIICIGCLLIMGVLGGCSAKEVKETYILTTVDIEFTIEKKITLYGTGDTLDIAVEHLTVSFNDRADSLEEKEIFTAYLHVYDTRSEYITMEWSEENNTVAVITTTDFRQAHLDNAPIFSDEIVFDTQYSIEETVEEYLSYGYKRVVEDK